MSMPRPASVNGCDSAHRRIRFGYAAFFLACSFLLGACTLFTSLDGLAGGGYDDASTVPTDDAPPDDRHDATAPPDDDAGTDSGVSTPTDASDAAERDAPKAPDAFDAPADSPAEADAVADAGDSACPGNAGPTGVRIGTYCIDATEVTNTQYGAFVVATGDVTSGQPAVCSWNTTYTPPGGWTFPPGAENRPAVNVDWCDAYAYCRWAGKRLCGRIGGGPNPDNSAADRTLDQWFRACSPDGGAYPYGVSYDGGACNDLDYGAGHTTDVGSLASCSGGVPGLFDMSGNVYEWEDSCAAATGPNDSCLTRGGGYDSSRDAAVLGCAETDYITRSHAYDDVGFRCCSSP